MTASTAADILREVATCASRAAERVDAGDHDVGLDLAARAREWIDLALPDLRAATGVAEARR